MNATWKPNVTVAAVIERGGRYLLVEEQAADGLCYNQPAGHLEAGESLIEAVVRETLEESACDFTPQALLGIYQAVGSSREGTAVDYLRIAFTGSVGDPIAGRALDSGIVRTLWMDYDQITALQERHRSPLVLQCVDDHRRRAGSALDLLYCHPDARRRR
jgi:ADP-ribose pyrophosphatase YjhB (NUDIX family)